MRKAFLGLFITVVLLFSGYFFFADDIKHQIDLFNYPIAFSELVEAASNEYGVPRELIYAVILTESGFEPDAYSSAGAKGLMQLMDITNKDICIRSGKDINADIFEPQTNIDRGVYYLAYLNRQFGNWKESVAAYNAGIGRVKGWLSNAEYSSDGVTLDEIPIGETNAYVSAVMSAMNKYKELYFKD